MAILKVLSTWLSVVHVGRHFWTFVAHCGGKCLSNKLRYKYLAKRVIPKAKKDYHFG